MRQQFPVDVSCRLFYAQQDVVNMLYSAFQRQLCIVHGFFSQGLT